MKAKTLVVLLGAVAVLAACGGGNGGDSSTSSNVTFNNGTGPITAAQFSALLSGSAVSTTNSNTYFTAYKIGSGSSAKSLIVERGIPTDATKTGYVGMWITN